MKILTFSLLFCLLGQIPAQAETMTLQQAITKALAHHPELAAAQAETKAMTAEAQQAGAWSNPNLFLRMEAAPRHGDTWQGSERIFGFSQELSLFGKRGAQKDIGLAETRALDAQSTVLRRDLEARVRLAFAKALQASQSLVLQQEAADATDRLAGLVQHRQKAGDASAAEFRRARMAARTAGTQVTSARGKAYAALADLSALLGLDDPGQLKLVETPPAPQLSPGEQTVSARMTAARAWADVAQAAVASTSRSRWPDLEMEAGLRTSPEGESFDVGFRMALPILDRKSQALKAAKARQSAAGYQARALDRELRARQSAALAKLEVATQTLATYDTEIIPDAEASLAAAEASFQAGDVGLTEVLQITREWIGARQARLDWALSLAEAEAELVRWQ